MRPLSRHLYILLAFIIMLVPSAARAELNTLGLELKDFIVIEGNKEAGACKEEVKEKESCGPGGVLAWPIDCIPGRTCTGLGLPDIDGDGVAVDCGKPGYKGHEGTDMSVSPAMMKRGVAVYAAADGVVQWAFDGKFDQCPDASEPDCAPPASSEPGKSSGYQVCTELGKFCRKAGDCCCFWCFDGGNTLVLKHEGIPGVFATRYDHLKKGSITVKPGDIVLRGQKIAEVGSAGRSTGPHLHFEVWGTGYYTPLDPWGGKCAKADRKGLWINDPLKETAK